MSLMIHKFSMRMRENRANISAIFICSSYQVIVNRREDLETHQNYNISHYLCLCPGLCGNEDLHRHVLIVFLPN